jgi:hypothetical protein
MPRQGRDPNQWYAQYWKSRYLVGLNHCVNEDWFLKSRLGNGGPGYNLPNDRFSTSYERQVYFDCGRYNFHITSDDGFRFWVDGQLKRDEWRDWFGSYDVEVDLSSGNHELKIEHYENGGEAYISLNWTLIADCPDNIPPTGRITSPTDGTIVSSCPLTIQVEASDNESGVDIVEFHAQYDGGWHPLGMMKQAHIASIGIVLRSRPGNNLTIHVWDKAGNEADPGGYVGIT